MKKTILTREGAEKLREELKRLEKKKRLGANEAITHARESSDLPESVEYAQALKRQKRVERRIEELEGKLANAKIVDVDKVHGDSRVVLGASVTLRMVPQGESVCYRIVAEGEADVSNGKLSISAPLVRALLGREEGEMVSVETPGGLLTCLILEIRYGQ